MKKEKEKETKKKLQNYIKFKKKNTTALPFNM